ncbi:MAG: glycosyltransferase family 4 protein [Bacteroidota bacterium]|nr:glycosyltransferase family 4 protein [Bacteroidota bacterium]
MKRVLIVTYYWPPSGGAGVQRWVKLSKYFVRQGIIPYVVTVDPAKASYALLDKTLQDDVDAAVHVSHTSTLEPYGIYKTITRKKEIPFGGFSNDEKQQLKFSQKFTRFIRGNLFLPDARVGWNRYAFKRCCELIEKEKIDAVITTSPPHSTQLVGLKLKKKYNLPWLADLRDPWTGIYYYDKLYLSGFSKRRDAAMEREVLENANAVVVVSNDIRKNLLAKSPKLKPEKFHVIPNGFDREDFDKVNAEEKEKEFVVSYTGTLTNDYRLEGFLSAVKKLLSANVLLRLHITGSMPLNIKEKIEQVVNGKVRFRSHVSHHEAIAQMKAADVLLLVIPDANGNKGILTGKLFEYLASGVPILCIGPVDGDAAEIITNCKSGSSFGYEDAAGMENFIFSKYEESKASGKTKGGDAEVVNKFSREKQAEEIVRLLERI